MLRVKDLNLPSLARVTAFSYFDGHVSASIPPELIPREDGGNSCARGIPRRDRNSRCQVSEYRRASAAHAAITGDGSFERTQRDANGRQTKQK